MPVTVNVNRLSLCHKGSGGISIATAPDVCKTPPVPAPVPYPNIAFSCDLEDGTTTVFADGGNSIATRPSIFAKSIGDEPGTAGGVISGTFTKEASWITFSADVRIEGQNACRLTDKMWHNHQNTMNAAGELQPPVSGGSVDCDAMWREIDKEVEDVLSQGGDEDPIRRNRAITAAYARLYNAHPNLKWSGMGAFVSKQAGCGMRLARDTMNSWKQHIPLAGVRETSQALFRGLANGNKAIFRDIFPLFAFYARYGNEAFQRCADARGVSEDMKEAFNLFDRGDQESVEKATMLVARQEQLVTLEHSINSDQEFKNALGSARNAYNRYYGRPFGAQNPDVLMSSSCDGGPRVEFTGDIRNSSDRISMAERVSTSFDQLRTQYPGWFDDEMAILQHGTIVTTPKVAPPNGSVWPRNR